MTYEVAKIEDYGYKQHKTLNTIWKILSTVLTVFVILLIYLSIFIILIQSFNSSASTSNFESFTFEWYTKIFSTRPLWNSIKNTFIVSIVATSISTVAGTFIALGIYSLAKKHQKLMLLINNIPLLNADIVTGVGLMLVFSLAIGVFPYIFGYTTLILAHVYFSLPYVILSVLPKLRDVGDNLFEASIDLGIKPFKSLRKVIIPAIRAGIISGMILAFTMSFDDFVVSYFTTGNGVDTLSIWIYGSIGRKSLTPAVYAFSTLFTFVAAAIILTKNIVMSKMEERKHAKKK